MPLWGWVLSEVVTDVLEVHARAQGRQAVCSGPCLAAEEGLRGRQMWV